MAGYSGTPLAKKLGIADGSLVGLVGAADTFPASLDPLPERVHVIDLTGGADAVGLDVCVLFTDARGRFETELPRLSAAVFPAGGLWIAWPKRASRVPTDMTEDVVREVALPTGLVDNKVCAIDDTWSGLRLVHRKELRSDLSRGRRPS